MGGAPPLVGGYPGRSEPVPYLSDLLPREGQLALAVRAHSPNRLAETFAAYAGQVRYITKY